VPLLTAEPDRRLSMAGILSSRRTLVFVVSSRLLSEPNVLEHFFMARLLSIVLAVVTALVVSSSLADVVTFEDLTVPPSGYFNGDPGTLSPGQSVTVPWTSAGAAFSNTYAIDDYGDFVYPYWEGFSYSNVVNTTDPGFTNQYASYPGGGFASSTYAVSHYEYLSNPVVTLPGPATVSGFRIANTTYAALTMLNGDSYGFAAPLPPGGWFATTATGHLGATTTGSATFYLADLRGDSPPGILSTWSWFDLTSLGTVDSIEFTFSGSDTGAFGLNTPQYFAMDDLAFAVVPEPSTWVAAGGMAWMAVVTRHRRRLWWYSTEERV